ncbi:fluoride efflux transporter CrcB [Exiguobacterium sp. K1]|uniref:fluoride efflux transporter CrcB n=1 Tax=Exiguobacterium sp. K1 TaxID=2980105 RepID=UPI00299D270E|nr:fluoride efflux transporter CrcB [Exiguobacterium sp. K1]MDX1260672.1 fluoride efflux transporter CrcB [Exiguobacterium sp. K1]
MLYVLVGLAGILGASARYGLSLLITHFAAGTFPWATVSINLLGCFVLGYATHFLFKTTLLHQYAMTALGTGFVGSFTTFSTFSVESVELLRAGFYGYALIYILISLFGGLLMSYFGYALGTRRLRLFQKEEAS